MNSFTTKIANDNINTRHCLPYISFCYLSQFNRTRTKSFFPGLSSPKKCHSKIQGLSKFFKILSVALISQNNDTISKIMFTPWSLHLIANLTNKPSFKKTKTRSKTLSQNLLCELATFSSQFFHSKPTLISDIFHNARPNGQTPVGIPKKNVIFSDQTGSTTRNGSYHLWFLS